MIPRRLFSLGFLVLASAFAPAQTPKPAATPEKEVGQLDPKQLASMCEKADVVVLGKAYAILLKELDSEPPTPVYTTAQLETKGMKFLKGREKLGGKAEARVAEAFADLAQAASLLMGKSVIVAFQYDGKDLKLMMLNPLNATDLALIREKYPQVK